jgi:hypothetical protein
LRPDYRNRDHRIEYFDAMYAMNLKHRVHPGLVYLYMPELRKRLQWDEETALWFATINGHTQNPITSLYIMQFMPETPTKDSEWKIAQEQFDILWAELSFDTDRNKQKKDTIKGLHSYSMLVREYGSQAKLWSDKTYDQYWALASSIHSFGRLSAFSYLEYVHLNNFGADCTRLMFDDLEGSRSHRNGMFFLTGQDNMVYDKRQPDSHDGKYTNLKGLGASLEGQAELWLASFARFHPHMPNISKFTLESCLCQFKNGFFKRRYPGVYADMAWDRIQWYDKRSLNRLTKVFKEIREDHLPEWLRQECDKTGTTRSEKCAMYIETGMPYRAEHFMS